MPVLPFSTSQDTNDLSLVSTFLKKKDCLLLLETCSVELFEVFFVCAKADSCPLTDCEKKNSVLHTIRKYMYVKGVYVTQYLLLVLGWGNFYIYGSLTFLDLILSSYCAWPKGC